MKPCHASSSRISLSSPVELKEAENKEKLKVIRIRVYPTKEQKQVLNKWFGICRWTYNKCAEYINKNKNTRITKDELCAAFVNIINFEKENQWVKEAQYDTRYGAMNDAFNALKAWKAKKKINQKGGFHLKFRSKKDPTQSIVVLKKQWGNKRGMFKSIFSSSMLKSYNKRHPLPEELLHDSRLLRDKNHKYFLCIPISREKRQVSDKGKVVAIDPGIRTFLTAYDQDGEIHEWGKGDQTRLYRLAIHIDKLTSKSIKVKHAARYRMKKAIGRIYDRIRNLTDDVHKKAAKWLCENHQIILIPAFQSSQMTKKEGRRIHSKAARSMLHWSHFRFRQRLLFKATEYPGIQVKVVTEEYTSKTCGVCGNLHHNLGKNKLFTCPSCQWSCDRDINGARNILLKYLTEQQQIRSSLQEGGRLGHSPTSVPVYETDDEAHNSRTPKRFKTES